MRILVVDDHEIVRKGICSLLANESTLTLCGEAVDGKDAVEKAKALRPDIVLMDISMPQMNGLDATREINRLLPDTKVVIVSQHGTPETIRQAYRAGARGYVVKSAVASDLLPAIASINTEPPANGSDLAGLPPSGSAAAPGGRDVAVSSVDSHGPFKSTGKESPLNLREQIYRAIGESIDYGVWICDAEGRNIYASPSFLKLVGLTQEQYSALGWTQILHPDELEATVAAWEKCIREGSLWGCEHRFRTANGGWHYILARGVPMRDDQGKIVYWAGINLDIQHRKESEQQLLQLVESLEYRVSQRTFELQNATEKLRELTGTLLQTQDEERRRIARELHDGVGQLVVAMSMTLSNIVGEKEKLSPAARQTLDQSLALIDQASREIRTMSHLLHPPLLDEVGLDSALRWYIEGFSERSKITVRTEMAPGFTDDLPRELALSVFRIVQESLTNIHRHSESLTAFVKIDRAPGKITLIVEDQGKGIPADVQSRISSGETAGVGLRGMRERIRQFDGQLEFHSGPQGTRIVAILPVESEPQSAGRTVLSPDVDSTPSGSIAAESAQQPATILCIDDEASGLLARRLLLESAGYRVIEAHSGPEGIRLFKSEQVSVVILDYWMSGMKGTAVAAELKRINPNIPIIVLSGVSNLPGEAAGLVDQWFLKGSHRAEKLLESISTLLERRPGYTAE